MTDKQAPVAEWVGDFKLMADFLATIEESAHHNNETQDWSDRLCDCAFFAQRVAHVMLDLQAKHLEALAALAAITVQWEPTPDDDDADGWYAISDRRRSQAQTALAALGYGIDWSAVGSGERNGRALLRPLASSETAEECSACRDTGAEGCGVCNETGRRLATSETKGLEQQ